MRIVLDTNALLVSIPKNSKYRLIFDRFLSKSFTLIISNEILSEYTEIIAQKTTSTVSNNITELLSIASNVEKQDIYFNWQLIDIDKDDNKFVDCAIARNADFLVTNDKHFGILKTIEFPAVSTLTVEEFMNILKNQ